MPQHQTDLTGIVATFLKPDEHTEDSVREAALARPYDNIWLRVARGQLGQAAGGPAQTARPARASEVRRPTELLRLDLLDVDRGAAIRDDELLSNLSQGGRTVLHLAFGNLAVFRDGRLLDPEAAAVVLREELGTDLDALANLDEPEEAAEGETEGDADGGEDREPLALAVAHQRVLETGPMPPPPAFFRFRDRTLGMPGEPPDEDRALVFACDLAEARERYAQRPARETLELLRSLEGRQLAARLGPFAHAVEQVAAQLERAGDRPPASANDPNLFEVFCVLSGYGATAGESVRYLDERFFPLLALRLGAQLPKLDKSELAELAELGLLGAMTEVLPYSVPEGQVLQSFGDDELTPVRVAAGEAPASGEVEASVFALRPARLVEQIRAFDPERLSREVERFARHWHEAQGGAVALGEFEQWAHARAQQDQRDLDRFLVTLNDLDAVLDVADRNGLAVTVAFYAAAGAEDDEDDDEDDA